MLEKRFTAVPPQPFTADGTSGGLVTVPDTRLFKVKQKVFVRSNTVPSRDNLEIKRILNSTQMLVGPEKQPIHIYSDLSDLLVADSAVIGSNEQVRPSIPVEEITRAVYEEEPSVAIRSMLVDKEGNDYRADNPLPVRLSDGSISIGTVNAELEVQLSHRDNVPNLGDVHDSVRLGDGTNEATITPTNISKFALDVMPLNRLIRYPYDRIDIVSKNIDGDPTQIEFRSLGTLVATVNITYDADGDLQSVVVV